MRAMSLQLPLLSCLVTITLGKLVLQYFFDQRRAAVNFQSHKKSITYSVRFTTKPYTTSLAEDIYDCLFDRKFQTRHCRILELAEREEAIQEAPVENSERHMVINIPNLLHEQASVESVCINLSERYLSINQDLCLLPLPEGKDSDDIHLLKEGKLQLRKVTVGSRTIWLFVPLTIDLDDVEMMIPVTYYPLIRRVIEEKEHLKLSLLGGPPITLQHDHFDSSPSAFTFYNCRITFYEGDEWRLGQPFLRAYNVQIFKDHYKIGLPLESEASSSTLRLRALDDQ